MSTTAIRVHHEVSHPVQVRVAPALQERNRLTTAFRWLLALPHLLLVGGPIALALTWSSNAENGSRLQWGSAGVLGAAAAVTAVIAWFAVLFTDREPQGLWDLSAFYLRWRVRAGAYTALLRDEYPPFGDGSYPAELELTPPAGERDRLSVAFRIVLILPHLLCVWGLGMAWGVTTLIAWFAILFTGRFPEALYHFGVGVLRWNIRVEAYLLLLRDEYPPFSLH